MTQSSFPFPSKQASIPDQQQQARFDRERARWALSQPAQTADTSSQATPEATPPVTDGEIAALIDGRLSTAERERVLAALEADDEAATIWLMAAADLEREHGLAGRRQARRWHRQPWSWAIAASVVILAIFAANPFLPSLSGRIDRDLRHALAAGWQPAPSQASSVYGFGPNMTATASPLLQALHSGYAATVAELRNPTASSADTPARPREPLAAYDSGRWLALLDAAIVASPPPSADAFWSGQPRTGRRLVRGLARAPDSAPDITRVQPVLERLVEQLEAGAPDFNARWQHAMQRELERARLALDFPTP